MNTHTKLLGMGFRKTKICKPEYQSELGYSIMVPDDVDTRYDRINKKTIESQKIHPKSNSFYFLKYSDTYTIWVSVKNFDISEIWLYNVNAIPKQMPRHYNGFVKERLHRIYTISDGNSFRLESKTDILNLLPKEVKRDFILNELFK